MLLLSEICSLVGEDDTTGLAERLFKYLIPASVPGKVLLALESNVLRLRVYP